MAVSKTYMGKKNLTDTALKFLQCIQLDKINSLNVGDLGISPSNALLAVFGGLFLQTDGRTKNLKKLTCCRL